MPMDFGGLPFNVVAIEEYVATKEIKIIRDASYSLGSLVNGKVFITCLILDY